jgi:lysophospholipase L1-like esterase
MLNNGKIKSNRPLGGSSYFFVAFLIFSLSICAFYAFKTLLPNRLFTEITEPDEEAAADSVMAPVLAEKRVDSLPDTASKDSTRHPLERFFKKLFGLEKTKTGVVRIAFFGDSMIESDMMVHDFRKNYQGKYGGYGRGFVMLSNVSITWGLSRYDFSPDWVTYTFLKGVPPVPVGVSGYVSIAKNNAPVWTSFRQRKGAPALANAELFYGQSNNSNAKLTVIADRNTSVITNLETDKILNKQPLTSSESKELMLRFNNAKGIPFYGVNFTDGDGIYIDNFPMRSSTGEPLLTLNAELMNAFHQELQYDLIILEFGLNVIQPKITEYDDYAEQMTTTVSHLKTCFPGADFLVISAPDMGKKYGTKMLTNKDLHAVLQAQERYAENSGADFISLFQLMGGEGSMVKWVKKGIAKTDYAHFSSDGSKIAADLIFNQIESEYEEYKKKEIE